MESSSTKNFFTRARRQLKFAIQEHQIGLRMRALGHWLAELFAELWPVWVTLAGLVIALTVSCFLTTGTQERVRISGYFLQVLSVLTIAVRIGIKWCFLNRSYLWDLIKRFPDVISRKQPISGSASIGNAPAAAKAYGLTVQEGSATSEERIEALEERHKRLHKQLIKTRQHLESENDARRREIEREMKMREKEDNEIRKHSEKLSVGDLKLEGVYFVWLIIGIILPIFPREIAHIPTHILKAI